MRRIQFILVVLFVLSTIAFGMTYAYNTFSIDRVAPILSSDVNFIEVSASATDEELLAGLHAHDNVDGDITDKIRIKSVSSLIGVNSAQVTYIVFDEASNAATLVREIHYTDYHKPRFKLSKPLIYGASRTVTLLDRLSAYDVIDGDLTGKIQLTMLNLTTTIEGTYQVNVMVTNSVGDSTILPLTITIRNVPIGAPEIQLSDYLVYTEVNQEVDLAALISAVKDPSQPSAEISAKDVDIVSEIDYSTPGIYEAYYSYTGHTGLEYSAILTVVVE